MFRGGFDPFGNVHSMMHRQMQEMENLMESMMDPFGMMGPSFGGVPRFNNPRQAMIEDGSRDYRNPQRGASGSGFRQQQDLDALMPFGGGFGGLMGGGLFGGIGGMMQQMEQQALNNPNAHVYTQSTVIGMAPGEDGQMRYYEKTNSVRKAGDVKETRKTVRDTAKGVEKIAIGHHIGDRAHIVEKKRDRNGQIIEDQEFVGIKSNEAKEFDREWSSVTRQAVGRNRLQSRDSSSKHYAIDEDGSSSRSERRERQSSPYVRSADRKKPKGPIIEEVE